MTNKELKKAVRKARNVYVDALVMQDTTLVKAAKSEILRILNTEPENDSLWSVVDIGEGDILLSN